MQCLRIPAVLLVAAFFHSSTAAQSGAAWPGGIAGHLPPSQLVAAIVGSGQPLHRGLAVEFKLALIDEGQMLVADDVMGGLPFDQTREERQANNTSAVIEIPYNFSETAQNDPGGFPALMETVAAQLERHRVPDELGLAADSLCSGLPPGSEWTARATDASCGNTFVVTYRCTVTETDGIPRGLWLRTHSEKLSGAGDLESYCG